MPPYVNIAADFQTSHFLSLRILLRGFPFLGSAGSYEFPDFPSPGFAESGLLIFFTKVSPPVRFVRFCPMFRGMCSVFARFCLRVLSCFVCGSRPLFFIDFQRPPPFSEVE